MLQVFQYKYGNVSMHFVQIEFQRALAWYALEDHIYKKKKIAMFCEKIHPHLSIKIVREYLCSASLLRILRQNSAS